MESKCVDIIRMFSTNASLKLHVAFLPCSHLRHLPLSLLRCLHSTMLFLFFFPMSLSLSLILSTVSSIRRRVPAQLLRFSLIEHNEFSLVVSSFCFFKSSGDKKRFYFYFKKCFGFFSCLPLYFALAFSCFLVLLSAALWSPLLGALLLCL